jgi:predicted small secreted protein
MGIGWDLCRMYGGSKTNLRNTRQIMKKLLVLAVLVALSGCNTISGVGQDISGGANTVSGWMGG